VALTPGVGELELSSVFETYGGQALATRTVALSSDGRPVTSRHGLVFVPRGAVGAVAVDRLLVPGADAAARRIPMRGVVAAEYLHSRPGFAFDGVLVDAARHLDVATAQLAAKSMEYPTDGLELTGQAWPWTLVLRLVALAGVGGVLGWIGGGALGRKLAARRRVRAAA
jgi:hypothetical protein